MRGFGWYDEWLDSSTWWKVSVAVLFTLAVLLGSIFLFFVLVPPLSDHQTDLLGGIMIGLLIGIPVGIGVGRKRERRVAESDG